MPNIEPRILRGFRDYLPAKMIPRQKMIEAIERTFQSFGFVPLMTPALEYLDILTGKYGEEGDSLLYRFKDHGDREVGLRYDLTVPLARVVAQYPDKVMLPFRRYQIAPVWRAENPARGRFREFVQCDADIVGSADMCADAELVQLGCELLGALGVEKFVIRINNRKVLSALMAAVGVAPGVAEMGVLRTIDKLPKIGEEETARLLRSENGLGEEQVRKVLDFLKIRGSNSEVLQSLRALLAGENEGARELEQILALAAAAGHGDRVELDLSIARGLNYYTGTIYETFLTDLAGYGSVMSGGRYDGLIGVFKGTDIPAVGISLGIDRLLEGLVELGLLREEMSTARVLVTVFGPDTAAYSAAVAKSLRSAGIPSELFPAYAKVRKQFKHADRAGIRWVVAAGPDEAAKRMLKVKDLQAEKEEEVPLEGIAAYLGERVGKKE